MPLKTPKFWYAPIGWLAILLLPVAWLYQFSHRLFQASKRAAPYQADMPVICIGNAVAGGSGKTPVAIALMKFVKENKIAQNPVFLTRAYGSQNQDVRLVNIAQYDPIKDGDEAYLLAQTAPTIIANDRAEGAKLAQENKADLIIMDDGLLNNSLHKDITFLVIDRAVNFGNNKTIPAGPLREPLSRILPKSNAVICVGEKLQSDKPVFAGSVVTNKADLAGDYVAFAGLGRPEKFLQTLEQHKVNVTSWHEFADHHNYSPLEIGKLLEEAKQKNASLITTEKDYVRIPKDMKKDIQTLPISFKFENEKEILNFLKAHLK